MDKNVRLAKAKWERIKATTEPIIENITSGTFTPSDLNALASAIHAQSRLAYYLFDKQVKAMDVQASSYAPEIKTKLQQIGVSSTEENVNIVVDKVFQRLVAKQLPSMLKSVQRSLSEGDTTNKDFSSVKDITSSIYEKTVSLGTAVGRLPEDIYDRIEGIVKKLNTKQKGKAKRKDKSKLGFVGKYFKQISDDLQDYYGISAIKSFYQEYKELAEKGLQLPQKEDVSASPAVQPPSPTPKASNSAQQTKTTQSNSAQQTKTTQSNLAQSQAPNNPTELPETVAEQKPVQVLDKDSPVLSILESVQSAVKQVNNFALANYNAMVIFNEFLKYKFDDVKESLSEQFDRVKDKNELVKEKLSELRDKAESKWKSVHDKIKELDENPMFAMIKKAAGIAAITGIVGIVLAQLPWKKWLWSWFFGDQQEEQEKQTQGKNAKGETVHVFEDDNGLKHVITDKADGTKETSSGTLDPRVDKDGFITEDTIEGADGNSTEYIKYNPTTAERKRQIVYHDTNQVVDLPIRNGKVLADESTKTSDIKYTQTQQNIQPDHDQMMQDLRPVKPSAEQIKADPNSLMDYHTRSKRWSEEMSRRNKRDDYIPDYDYIETGKKRSGYRKADSTAIPTKSASQVLTPKPANTTTPSVEYKTPSQLVKPNEPKDSKTTDSNGKLGLQQVTEYMSLGTTSPNGTKSDETLAFLNAGAL